LKLIFQAKQNIFMPSKLVGGTVDPKTEDRLTLSFSAPSRLRHNNCTLPLRLYHVTHDFYTILNPGRRQLAYLIDVIFIFYFFKKLLMKKRKRKTNTRK
jgi:hypothetical protein